MFAGSCKHPITGLGPVSESIIQRSNSLIEHVTRLVEDTPSHQALCCATSTGPSIVPCPLTVAGDVVQAAPETDASTHFMGTTTLRLLTSEDEPCHVDIRG